MSLPGSQISLTGRSNSLSERMLRAQVPKMVVITVRSLQTSRHSSLYGCPRSEADVHHHRHMTLSLSRSSMLILRCSSLREPNVFERIPCYSTSCCGGVLQRSIVVTSLIDLLLAMLSAHLVIKSNDSSNSSIATHSILALRLFVFSKSDRPSKN